MKKQIIMTTLAAFIVAATTLFTGCKKEVVTGVTVKPVAVMLAVNEPHNIIATFETETGTTLTGEATWSSSNSNIATVDTEGKVTAHAVGEAVIICTTKEGNYAASTNVIVKPQPIDGDYATSVPKFYIGKTEIDNTTVDNDKLLTVKYLSKNKIYYVIKEKFTIPRAGGFTELTMDATIPSEITKEGDLFSAKCSTDITIGGTTTTLALEGTFINNEINLLINFADFPGIGEVNIYFIANGTNTINE